MTPRALFWLVLGTALVVGAGIVFAAPLDKGEWYRSLKVPGTERICCDEADGHPVESDWRNGQWWAKWQGQWIPVPPEIVLRTVSIEENAVLFVYGGQYRCFVPPLRGL